MLALAAAHQNDRVGALLFSDEVERVIPPRKGRRHALRVIRDLVAFEPAGRRTNLAASLSYASRLLRHRSIVVVLSDFIAEGWERPLRRLGGAARGRGDHGGRSARARAARVRLDRDAWMPSPGRRVLVDTGSRDVRARVAQLARAAPRGAEPGARRGGRRPGAAGDRRRLRAPAPPRLRAPRPPDPPRMIALARARCRLATAPPDRRRHDLGEPHGRRPGRVRRPRRRLGRAGPDRAARPRRVVIAARRLGRDRAIRSWSGGRAAHASSCPARCSSAPAARSTRCRRSR